MFNVADPRLIVGLDSGRLSDRIDGESFDDCDRVDGESFGG